MNGDGLTLSGLTVHYGGACVVDGLSLDAPVGRVTGLIGPNGAGKTTTFDACSGFVRPTAGTVRLFGEDVTSLGAAARARRGLGRTFQRMALFESMTVGQNLALAREAAQAGGSPWRQLLATPKEHRAVNAAVDDALTCFGLGPLAHRPVATLSAGDRRLVAVARATCAGFRILLLDEPSSGLDERETGHLAGILRELVNAGLGILLVEHDMALVMNTCERIFVVDFGKLIFAGTPAEVKDSPVVQAAYLGVGVV